MGPICTLEVRFQLGGILLVWLYCICIAHLLNNLSCHTCLTPDGLNFTKDFPNFDSHYQAPFTKFLSGIYCKFSLTIVMDLLIHFSQLNPFANHVHFLVWRTTWTQRMMRVKAVKKTKVWPNNKMTHCKVWSKRMGIKFHLLVCILLISNYQCWLLLSTGTDTHWWFCPWWVVHHFLSSHFSRCLDQLKIHRVGCALHYLFTSFF